MVYVKVLITAVIITIIWYRHEAQNVPVDTMAISDVENRLIAVSNNIKNVDDRIDNEIIPLIALNTDATDQLMELTDRAVKKMKRKPKVKMKYIIRDRNTQVKVVEREEAPVSVVRDTLVVYKMPPVYNRVIGDNTGYVRWRDNRGLLQKKSRKAYDKWLEK